MYKTVFNLFIQRYSLNAPIRFQAIKFVSSLNWDRERDGTFASLSCIINHLLRQPLTAESENQFECALAIFYSPVSNWDKDVQYTYKTNVDNLARRYFKHLIRYSAFEKAFLMAVDLNDPDLFMVLFRYPNVLPFLMLKLLIETEITLCS